MRISKLSPSLAVALVALVLSTTGTTIAATRLLPTSSVGAAQLRTGAVDGAKIRDRSITIRDLAPATTLALKTTPAGSITSVQLADGAVGASKLVDGSIVTTKLADGAVGTSKLGDGSITSIKLADRAVTADKLAGAIPGASLLDGSVGGSKIMSGTIETSDLVPNEAWRVLDDPGQPQLLDIWVNQPSLGYEEAAFRKDRFGVVHLRGFVSRSGNVAGSNIFVLPEGYRPLRHRMFPITSTDGGGVIAMGAIDVESNGTVFVYGSADDRNVSLDGISFVAGE